MILSIPSLSESHNINVSEFILEDFRYISFLIEQNNDIELYKFLISKIQTPCNAYDKFYALFKIRMLLVNDSIILNNGKSNVKINLKSWDELIVSNYKDIRKDIIFEDFIATVNYPEHMIYDNYNDYVIGCISRISYNGENIEFFGLDNLDKISILEKIPPTLYIMVKDYINIHRMDELVVMESRFELPEININMFNNNAYELLKVLYNYYKYDDILELIFILSRKINDVGYINSRNPRDLDILIQIYTEDVEKTT